MYVWVSVPCLLLRGALLSVTVQLGYKNTEAVPRNVEGAFFLPTPRLVESLQGLRVVKVVAGWGHSAAVCQNGDVYTCGR